MFIAGGVAGAIARTASAPLDRIKLLFQAVASSGTSSTAYTGVWQSIVKIFKEESLLSFWKGNGTNVIRIFPYSAAQLMANDQYKRLLVNAEGELTVPRRLMSGALAGMTATTLTHPLDTVRLRLALPTHPYSGMTNAFMTISRTEGPIALYKGLLPTLIGIAPYAALNFACYDLFKHYFYGGSNTKQNVFSNLLIGAVSGTFAATVCYPLDTIRRRMQMKGITYTSQLNAFVTIWKMEGHRGFYRGWSANTLKVIPQNSIRFVSYELMKKLLGVTKAKTDT
eukprot:g3940.t1